MERLVDNLTRKGASVTGRTEDSVSFTYYKGPNGLLLLVLLLLLFLPGIVYWVASSRNVGFTVTVKPVPGGCRLRFGGESRAGYDEYRHWLKTLPGPTPASVEGATPATEAETPADIPTQIQKLAELRDAGVVSEEEFQAKRRKLLDLM